MSHPLFDITKCAVPYVPSVTFKFISDCSIQPPPPPIFDCPQPPKTFRVIPECPSIAGSVTLSTAAEGCITPRKHIVVHRTPRCGGEENGCNFFIDLDLAFPVPVPPCPSIKGGTISVRTYQDGCAKPKNSIRVRKKESVYSDCKDKKSKAKCNFTIDLDIAVPIPVPPCPSIKGGSIKTSVFYETCHKPKNSIRVRKRSLPHDCNSKSQKPTCVHTIDLDIQIPIPVPPCPSIKGGSIKTSVFYTDCKTPKNSIKIRKRSLPVDCKSKNKPNCVHTIDIDLDIPIPRVSCPLISIIGGWASLTQIKIPSGDEPCDKPPPRCKFTIKIPPPPCPDISAGSVSVKVTHETCLPPKKNKLKTRKLPPKSGSSCRFAIALDLAIPVPKISCPLISVTNEPAPRPSITYRKTTAASCKNALSPPRCAFTINIPPPPCPEISKGSFSIKQNYDVTKPSGFVRTRKLAPKPGSSCRFAIDIGIALPLPVCPQISAGSLSVKQLAPGKKPTGVIVTRKLSPKPGSSCRFAIDIGIGIPLPTCPQFSKGSFSVHQGGPTQKPTGKLTPRTLPGTSGSSCRYAFDFDLKIPTPACPEISKGSFSVKIDGTSKPSGKLTTRKLARRGSSCRYAIDFDLKLPVPPCPEISKGSFSIHQGGPTQKPSGKLTPRKLPPKPGSSCRLAFDIDMKIPTPACPEISKGSFSVKIVAPSEKPSGKLVTRKLARRGSSCRYAIDFDLKIPKPTCPKISAGSVSLKQHFNLSPWWPVGKIKPRQLPPKGSDSCRFNIALDLTLPHYEVSCPSFTVTTNPNEKASVRYLGAIEPGSGELWKKSRRCKFAINIPPLCPEVSKGSFSIHQGGPTQKPTGKLTARKLEPKPGSSCRFAFDVDMKIPTPACPEISKGSFSVHKGGPTQKPTGKLVTRKLARRGSSCRYAVDFDLKIPTPACPEISKGSFSIHEGGPAQKPTGKLVTRKLERRGSSCRYAIDFDLKIPTPACPEISKGSFSVKIGDFSRPTGTLTTRKLERRGSSCRYAIDFNLKIPLPPCPEISIGKFSITTFDPLDPTKPSGFLRRTKLQAKTGSSCREGIELGIDIPVPRELHEGVISCLEWNSGTRQDVYLSVPGDGSPSPVSVLNKLGDIRALSGYTFVIVGKVLVSSGAYDWYLISYDQPNCGVAGGKKAEHITMKDLNTATDTSQLVEGNGAQILTHDTTCAKWFNVKKQKIVYDLEAYNQGLRWKTKDVWILDDVASPEDKEITCEYIGPTYTGGTIDLGGYGSGNINITGDCNKTIAATISLNTTDCPSGP